MVSGNLIERHCQWAAEDGWLIGLGRCHGSPDDVLFNAEQFVEVSSYHSAVLPRRRSAPAWSPPDRSAAMVLSAGKLASSRLVPFGGPIGQCSSAAEGSPPTCSKAPVPDTISLRALFRHTRKDDRLHIDRPLRSSLAGLPGRSDSLSHQAEYPFRHSDATGQFASITGNPRLIGSRTASWRLERSRG